MNKAQSKNLNFFLLGGATAYAVLWPLIRYFNFGSLEVAFMALFLAVIAKGPKL